MDYLQEAIEKARRQRDGAIGQTPELGSKALHPAAEGGAGNTRAKPTRRRTKGRVLPLPSEVRYQTTRRIEPTPDLLSYNRVIAGEINDSRVEPYRQLRSQVLSTMNFNGWNTLAVTGPREGVGKSLTAVNLAIAISQEVNQTVILVDLDLRTPSVHTTLGIDIDKGIVDHLTHGEPLENILINPGYPRLVVVPGLPQGQNASELLSSPEMKAFFSDVVNRYPDRLAIFDLPPLLRNDDAMVFVPNTDASLLVLEDGVTTPDEIKRCLQLLKHSELLGTVLNKAR